MQPRLIQPHPPSWHVVLVAVVVLIVVKVRVAAPAGGARGMLLERWSLYYSPLQPGSSGYCSRAATDVAAVYKRLVRPWL
jgi:hypothetical protein